MTMAPALFRWFLRLAAVGLLLYVAAFVLLVVFQRRMMYFPSGAEGGPTKWGLPRAQALTLATPDGEKLSAWYEPARADRSLFLYFHGNGGALPHHSNILRHLVVDGSGFLAVDYRGYGGSSGTPSERGLLIDGATAYAEAKALGYAPERIVILGESLGTGVAIAVAAEHPSKALVLDSAYDSTVDVAAAQYWMFPVRMAMMDTFMSKTRIGAVTAPKLFLHGEDDPVIPIAAGRRLFAAASEPKTFVAFPDQGHIVLATPAAMDRMKRWVAALDADKIR